MTLQSAANAKSSSDNASIQEKPILLSLIMNVINDEITRLSTITDTEERIFKANIEFESIFNKNKNEITIIQSDQSQVFLVDIESALVDASYRVSSRAIKSSRIGINDRVKMQIAWG